MTGTTIARRVVSECMVDKGRIAVVHFVGRIETGEDTGEVFDTSDIDVALAEGIHHGQRDYKPLEFRVGAGEVLDGIDDAVAKMDRGETRIVRVEPERAFGPSDEANVINFPRAELESRSDVTAAEGELVKSENDEIGWITDVANDVVTVDFNHELAGQSIEFELRVLDVLGADDETD